MKNPAIHKLTIAILASVMIAFASCHESDLWSQLPTKISEFIAQYFPESKVSDYTESADSYHVRIADGPAMTFDKTCRWESINGYGMPLPEVFLFDQLPPALYQYLETADELNAVFAVDRDSRTYTVVLLDSTLIYDIATQQVSGVAAPRYQ